MAKSNIKIRACILIGVLILVTLASTRLRADTGTCGGQMIAVPFTDVAGSPFFCQIASAFFSGLTNGTTATTYSPGETVNRGQMAAFTTRTLDQSLRRGSRRAALDQWWTTQTASNLGLTDVGLDPELVKSDGTDLWVVSKDSGTVSRVRASDGKLLETWTGAAFANGVLVAMGKIFVTARVGPGRLYQIDPTQPAGTVTTLSTSLGASPSAIAFDGRRIWTANSLTVSLVTLDPFSVFNVSGFDRANGLVFDGSHMWVTDESNLLGFGRVCKLDTSGNGILCVGVGSQPLHPAFDGTNIWVPNFLDDTVTVIRAKGDQSGTVVATLTGNGLNLPFQAAFDGERILVTNQGGFSVSLWKASDLTPIGTFPIGGRPFGACSDGLNFWITLNDSGKLARF